MATSLTTVPGLQKYTVSNLIAMMCLFSLGMIKAYDMDFVVRVAVVDPGFTKKGGGGHKILDLLSLLPHIYKINKTTRWEVVKNSASPFSPFL